MVWIVFDKLSSLNPFETDSISYVIQQKEGIM